MARTTSSIQENNPTIGTSQRHSTGRHGLPTDVRTEVSIETRFEPAEKVVPTSLDEASLYLGRGLRLRGALPAERRQIVGMFKNKYYSKMPLYSDPKALLKLVEGTLNEYEGR